jgi:PTH1 family peptidyl-tRNA hydrolase
LKAGEKMFLIVGLGNPGEKYKNNRHNIGFMVIDELAASYGGAAGGAFQSKYKGLLTQATIGDHKCILLKPQTFMNESGQSIGEAARFYKIPTENIIIIHDELDLDPCKIRVRLGGGLAGHNGLKSAKAHLKTDEFWRVRYGIGHPGDRDRVSGYVLSDFAKAEATDFDDKTYRVVKDFGMVLDGQAEEFMTEIER